MKKILLLFLFANICVLISCGKEDSFLDEEYEILDFGNTISPDSTEHNTSDSTQTGFSHNDIDSTRIVEELPMGPIISLKFDLYMNQERTTKSVQASASYNNYLFQFLHANEGVYIYDLEEKKLFQYISLEPNGRNHCNNVSFSNKYYDINDKFPLLYVSGSKISTYNQVQVYRIEKTDSFKITKVQDIVLPKSSNDNNLFWTGVAIDNDHDAMIVYGNTNGAQFATIKIPDISLDMVHLTDNDIIDKFTLSGFVHQQGAVIKNGILYVTDGVPQWGDTNCLRIIDLKNHCQLYNFNLTSMGYNVETEGLTFYGNTLLVSNCKRSGIYSLKYIIKK